MEEILGYVICAFVSALVSALVTRHYMRFKRRQVKDEVAEEFSEMMKKTLGYCLATCPRCVKHKSGELFCEDADLPNMTMYGKCLNYQEKRY